MLERVPELVAFEMILMVASEAQVLSMEVHHASLLQGQA